MTDFIFSHKMYIFNLKIYIFNLKINLIPYFRHPCQGTERALQAGWNGLTNHTRPGSLMQAVPLPPKPILWKILELNMNDFRHCLPYNFPIFASKIKLH